MRRHMLCLLGLGRCPASCSPLPRAATLFLSRILTRRARWNRPIRIHRETRYKQALQVVECAGLCDLSKLVAVLTMIPTPLVMAHPASQADSRLPLDGTPYGHQGIRFLPNRDA